MADSSSSATTWRVALSPTSAALASFERPARKSLSALIRSLTCQSTDDLLLSFTAANPNSAYVKICPFIRTDTRLRNENKGITLKIVPFGDFFYRNGTFSPASCSQTQENSSMPTAVNKVTTAVSSFSFTRIERACSAALVQAILSCGYASPNSESQARIPNSA